MSDRAVALLPDWLVPVCPEGQVLDHHAVVVDRGRIEAIVPADQLDNEHAGIEVRRLNDCVLIPGLVNAHTHAAMSLMRGLADDLPLMEWLQGHIWPAEQRWVGAEFVRAGSELAMAEMLASGTTCFNDLYFFPDVTAATAIRAGMRAVVGMPVINLPTAWADNEDEYFSRGLQVHQELLSEPLVSTAFAPHAPYTVSDEAFKRMCELAEEMDVPIHIHLLETRGEIEDSRKRFGQHPLDRLDALGVLGPRLLAVHMTQLDDRDLDRVARAGISVAHCPASNLKLASGICRVAELDRRGVNVAIGTDGAASNNTLDMFAEMRLAALLAKGASGNPEAVPAHRALSMATIQGARALGLDDRIGSIEPGKQADLVAVDLSGLDTQPVHHVISQLVYACSRHQVSAVWVAGEQVLTDGRPTRMDPAEISRRVGQWRRRLAGTDQESVA